MDESPSVAGTLQLLPVRKFEVFDRQSVVKV